MKLLYVYISDTFGMNVSFSKKDINFEGHQCFEFQQGYFKLIKETAYYQKLYSEKLTMTALVGENGTGKTTFLRFINWLMNGINGHFNQSVFKQWTWNAIVEDNYSRYMIHTETSFEDSGPFVERIEIQKIDITNDGLVYSEGSISSPIETGLVYYSPHFNFIDSLEDSASMTIDVSSDGLLKKFKDGQDNELETLLFRRRDIKLQIEFIEYSKSKKAEFIFFKKYIRNQLVLHIDQKSRVNPDRMIEINGVDHDFYDNLNDLYDSVVPTFSYELAKAKRGSEKDLIAIFLYRRIIELIYIHYTVEALKEKPSVKPMTTIKLSSKLGNEKDLLDLMKAFIYNNCSKGILNQFDTFINFLEENGGLNSTYNALEIDYSNVEFILNFEVKIKNVLSLPKGLSIFTFDWADLSTGEKAYLNLFSRLYYASLQKDSTKKNNVILLIDEPSTGFHPNWQKEYLKNLIALIDILWVNNKQLIITTHSPFVLSDFQSQEVIRLSVHDPNMNQSKSTFGANIHELLGDDFYLKDGYIGDLSKEKINNAIRSLNSDSEEDNQGDIKKFIHIIGEPYLREKLLEMFYRKYPDEIIKEKRILELERELTRLKND